jgi:coproporphyrinogen III oxidase
MMMEDRDYKNIWISFIHELQDTICHALEEADGKEKFHEDRWTRPEGGGGITRVIGKGTVFEKGGVNTSVVSGVVSDAMRAALKLPATKGQNSWFACGLSLVLHPLNPFVPTVHCNYRMFELYDESGKLVDRWFGGGTDLTPFYLFEEDVKHFHRTYKQVCDNFDPAFYPEFKKACDNYFVNVHRSGERRGVGGIFYDYQRADKTKDTQYWMDFASACGEAFLPSYLPIVAKRKYQVFTERNKHWQEIRRGRYVEFNLVHDRGTIFGLRTNGRIESILMSLPPTVRFDYNDQPAPDSEEAKLLEVCRHPVDWLN